MNRTAARVVTRNGSEVRSTAMLTVAIKIATAGATPIEMISVAASLRAIARVTTDYRGASTTGSDATIGASARLRGYQEPAFARGYSDGWEHGVDDRRDRDRYDPVATATTASATRATAVVRLEGRLQEQLPLRLPSGLRGRLPRTASATAAVTRGVWTRLRRDCGNIRRFLPGAGIV